MVYRIIYFFILLILSAQNTEAKIPDFALKQKKAVVIIYIVDKNGSEVASGKGFVVDSDGIIAASCKLISKWLEDVEYSLIVVTEESGSYPINKLIAYNCRQDIALFEINAKGLSAVKLPSDYNLSKYIQRHIEIYKKSSLESSNILRPPTIAKQTKKSATPSEPLRSEETLKIPKKIETESADTLLNLGLTYYKLGRYSEAIDSYKQALSMKPDYTIYNKLGVIYIITGKYSMAIDAFLQAATINSKNPETYFNLGISYLLNGEKDMAYEQYIILNRLDKEQAETLFELLYR